MVVFGGGMTAIQARYLLIAMTLLAYAAIASLTAISDLTIQPDGIVPLIAAAFSFVLIGQICARRGMPRLQAATECFGFGVLVGIPIALSTYLAVRVGFPLRDDMLAGIDASLGFEWQRTIGFVETHPAIAAISNISYRTFSYQLIFWPVALSILGYCARAYITVAAFAILCLLSSLISIWTPAIGTYPHYGFDAAALRHLDAIYGFYFLDQFHDVRSKVDFVWSLTASKGILTFPSVHAAAALLCAWAAWPVRLLRFPAIALNIAMGLSTVPSGGHYLIDVAAGVAVAVLSIRLAILAGRAVPAGGIASWQLKSGIWRPAGSRHQADARVSEPKS